MSKLDLAAFIMRVRRTGRGDGVVTALLALAVAVVILAGLGGCTPSPECPRPGGVAENGMVALGRLAGTAGCELIHT